MQLGNVYEPLLASGVHSFFLRGDGFFSHYLLPAAKCYMRAIR